MNRVLDYIQATSVGIVFGCGISIIIYVLTGIMLRNLSMIHSLSIFLRYPISHLWFLTKLIVSTILFLTFCHFLGTYILELA